MSSAPAAERHLALIMTGADSGLHEATAESELPLRAGELLANRYVVDRVLARGGMGVVWLGRHVELDQPVAIKFLRRALARNEVVVQRFLNEARAAAALHSQHVVRIIDVGQLDSGQPYLVMEHLQGVDLCTLVETEGPLDVDRAIQYVLEACEALSEAHSASIVHRDVKPENLFLSRGASGREIVKIVDFGLAKRLDGAHTKVVTGPQESMGSPGYMSPEQIVTPHAVDARTDIWSMGVVLYELLSGALPFDGDSVTEVCARVLHSEPKSLLVARPGLDRELEAIVLSCLEKDPSRRPASIDVLAGALRGYRAVATSDTQPVDWPPPPSSHVQRRRDPRAEDADFAGVPGVHSRAPGVAAFALVALVALSSATLYAADRTGRIRLRDATDGWLTPAALRDDVDVGGARFPEAERPLPQVAWGVFSPDPTTDADGMPALRAEPEPEIQDEAEPADEGGAGARPGSARERAVASEAEALLTPREITRRRRAYADYLHRRGLRPLQDVLDEIEPRPPAEASDDEGRKPAGEGPDEPE